MGLACSKSPVTWAGDPAPPFPRRQPPGVSVSFSFLLKLMLGYSWGWWGFLQGSVLQGWSAWCEPHSVTHWQDNLRHWSLVTGHLALASLYVVWGSRKQVDRKGRQRESWVLVVPPGRASLPAVH